MRTLPPDPLGPSVRTGLLLAGCAFLILQMPFVERLIKTHRNRAAPRIPAAAAGPDLVLVTIDSLRPDHIGAYGSARSMTPNLDRLARRGVRFQRAYAQAPHTSFSIAALLTGRHFGTLTRLVPEARFETLAARLAGHGFTGAAIYPPALYFADAEQLAPYRAEHFGFSYVRHAYQDAEATVSAAIDFFQAERPRRAFAWLHLFEPHEPYDLRAPLAGATEHERYEQEVAAADAALGRLFSYLQEARPGAIVVVTADHGEAFGEHGEHYHGTGLHEEQIRVPLIVVAPGLAPRVVADPVQLVDVFPTALELLGVPAPHGLAGTSLVPQMKGQAASRPAFAALPEQRAILRGHEKLIWDLRWGTSRYFDLRDDPAEQHDLSQARPEAAARLRAELYAWIEDSLQQAEELRAAHAGAPLPSAILRARLADATAAEELVDLMASQGPLPQRYEAAELLLRLPPMQKTLSRLLPLLHHSDPHLAACSQIAALRLGHRGELPRVWRILRNPAREYGLRLAAGLALARQGARAALAPLLDLFAECPSVPQCRQAIYGLARLRDRRATRPLLDQLSNPMLQREVLHALAVLADPAAVPALVDRLLQDERPPVRVAAARALSGMKTSAQRTALLQAARSDPEQVVRDAAEAALGAPSAQAARVRTPWVVPPRPDGSARNEQIWN